MSAHKLEFKELRASDAAALQAVYETVPAYYALFGGLDPREAEKALTEAPEVDVPHYAWGVLLDGELIGHLDFLLGYPEPTTAYLGLLLIRGDRHGAGLGRQAFETWLGWVMAGPFERVRLGIVAGNHGAEAFWRRVGFHALGETRTIEINGAPVDVALWEYEF